MPKNYHHATPATPTTHTPVPPLNSGEPNTTGNSRLNNTWKGDMSARDSHKLLLTIIPLLFFIASSLLSWSFFRPTTKPIFPQEEEISVEVDTDSASLLATVGLPKDQVCPLNGALFTLPEKEAWGKRRPLAVMIENSAEARPQSGLANADIVFEAVAESGITRFMALYYCAAQESDVVLAPIRSARTYYINLASGFNLPMYVHVGGANVEGPTNALGQLADYGWNSENDINQFSVGYPTFVRDYNRIPGKEVATEHTMVTSTEKLWAVAAKRGWTNITPERRVGKTTVPAADWSSDYQGWTFVSGAATGSVTAINYGFWSGMDNFDVAWQYDSATNRYLRSEGGAPHLDLNTGEQLAYANVVVLQVKETGPLNEQKHMMYEVIGKGTAYVFNNGEAHEVDWSKKTRESELEFTLKGEPYEFTAGPVWISIVDIANQPSY
jgi:hypothetical protein